MGTTDDEIVGWLYSLNRCEFEQTQGVGDGQGSLACCSPWDHKESDMTEPLNQTELISIIIVAQMLSCAQLFVTLWTVACQTPLSMGFSRQEY